jgi:hypothetical protein
VFVSRFRVRLLVCYIHAIVKSEDYFFVSRFATFRADRRNYFSRCFSPTPSLATRCGYTFSQHTSYFSFGCSPIQVLTVPNVAWLWWSNGLAVCPMWQGAFQVNSLISFFLISGATFVHTFFGEHGIKYIVNKLSLMRSGIFLFVLWVLFCMNEKFVKIVSINHLNLSTLVYGARAHVCHIDRDSIWLISHAKPIHSWHLCHLSEFSCKCIVQVSSI